MKSAGVSLIPAAIPIPIPVHLRCDSTSARTIVIMSTLIWPSCSESRTGSSQTIRAIRSAANPHTPGVVCCRGEHPANDVTHADDVHQKRKGEKDRLAQPDQRKKAQCSEWRVVEQHRVRISGHPRRVQVLAIPDAHCSEPVHQHVDLAGQVGPPQICG